jgi:hypothetical protein
LNLKKDVAEDALLLTGRSLQYAGRYSDAIEKFTAFLASPGKKAKRIFYWHGNVFRNATLL